MEVCEWKEIATAPKDGYPVWTKGQNYGRPNNGEHFEWAYWDGSHWKGPGANGPTLLYLTHWCPTPPDRRDRT